MPCLTESCPITQAPPNAADKPTFLPLSAGSISSTLAELAFKHK